MQGEGSSGSSLWQEQEDRSKPAIRRHRAGGCFVKSRMPADSPATEPSAVAEVDLALADTAANADVRRIAAALLPDFYAQVKRMARRERARVGGGDTLQTTALANEAWLRLRDSRGFVDEMHLLRAAALAMRHALINHALAQRADKRGAGAVHLTLSHAGEVAIDSDDALIDLNEALQKLARQTPRLAEVVECRFFAGYSEQETASALGVSLRTAQRDWLKARAWLYRELKGGPAADGGTGDASA